MLKDTTKSHYRERCGVALIRLMSMLFEKFYCNRRIPCDISCAKVINFMDNNDFLESSTKNKNLDFSSNCLVHKIKSSSDSYRAGITTVNTHRKINFIHCL